MKKSKWKNLTKGLSQESNLYPGDLTKPLIVMYLLVATDISPVARLTEPRIRWRSTRLFFQIFANEHGWNLSFEKISHVALVEAMIESMNDRNSQ